MSRKTRTFSLRVSKATGLPSSVKTMDPPQIPLHAEWAVHSSTDNAELRDPLPHFPYFSARASMSFTLPAAPSSCTTTFEYLNWEVYGIRKLFLELLGVGGGGGGGEQRGLHGKSPIFAK